MKLPYRCGNYLLVERIARGGMAEIYRARYRGVRGFTKSYAVKRILPAWSDNREVERMLVDEARALVHLQHQNIVQIFELGKDRQSIFISMEYVDGFDLRQIYQALERSRSRMPEKFACFIIMEILKALDFAHNQRDNEGRELRIVHRDISPQNIMISRHGEVKLADFGIAKGLHRDQETTAHQLKGKIAYMSPEQVLGGVLDRRSDIFSLAVVFYEIITGMRLFRSESDYETLQNVREVRLPADFGAYVCLDIRRMIEKALSSSPSDRYPNAEEFLCDLRRYVLSGGHLADGRALAQYLSTIEIEMTDVDSLHTRPLGGSSRPALLKRQIGRLILFLLIIPFAAFRHAHHEDMATLALWQGLLPSPGAERLREVGPVPMAEPEVREPAVPERAVCVLKIGSEPTGASGHLRYNGSVRRFVTPTVMTDLECADGGEGEIALTMDGYQEMHDQFTFSEGDTILKKSYDLVSRRPAVLSVQARPWGLVSVSGLMTEREAPVHRFRIKEGPQKITVRYPPTKKTLSSNLDVVPGAVYRCLADFGDVPRIQCR